MSVWLMILLLVFAECLTASTSRQQSPIVDMVDRLTNSSVSLKTHMQYESSHMLTQCHDLSARFPELVSFPGTEVYDREQALYWTSQQADSRPACRLTPRNTHHTSEIMQHLHKHEIDFAIVSGGRGTADGASNIYHGVTLDLSLLSAVSYSYEKSSITVQSGARWKDVYELLDSQKVTASGARTGSVGVGGYLLGGGISTLAARHGWSVDSVTSMEVVLANGAVRHTDPQQYPDLFRALRGGGSNFAIPTRFTMRVFEFDLFQYVVVRYESEDIDQLIGQFSIAVQEAESDMESSFDISMAVDPGSHMTMAFLTFTRFGELEKSPLLRNFLSIPHSPVTTTGGTPKHLASALDESNPAGYRYVRLLRLTE